MKNKIFGYSYLEHGAWHFVVGRIGPDGVVSSGPVFSSAKFRPHWKTQRLDHRNDRLASFRPQKPVIDVVQDMRVRTGAEREHYCNDDEFAHDVFPGC